MRKTTRLRELMAKGETLFVPGCYNGGPVNHLEVVAYDLECILPLYLVRYRHATDCRCKCCDRDDDFDAGTALKLHQRGAPHFCKFGLRGE